MSKNQTPIVSNGDIEKAFGPKGYLGNQLLAQRKVVTSRLENVQDGVCPYCKGKMTLSEASGFPVYVCGRDRAVSPVPDNMSTENIVMKNLY